MVKSKNISSFCLKRSKVTSGSKFETFYMLYLGLPLEANSQGVRLPTKSSKYSPKLILMIYENVFE